MSSKYLFDNNITPRIARALNQLEKQAEVHALMDVVDPATKDPELLKFVAANSYCLISCDNKQMKRTAERSALKTHRVTAVYLPQVVSNKKYWDQTEWIVKHWPNIIARVGTQRKGSILKMLANGDLIETTV